MVRADFFNFKSVAAKLVVNRANMYNGERLKWMQTKWLQFTKNSDIIHITSSHSDSVSDFQRLNVLKSSKQSKRAQKRHKVNMSPESEEQLKTLLVPLYCDSLPISVAKFRDLQDLCKSLVIPTEFHGYYNNLKFRRTVGDNLNEPD